MLTGAALAVVCVGASAGAQACIGARLVGESSRIRAERLASRAEAQGLLRDAGRCDSTPSTYGGRGLGVVPAIARIEFAGGVQEASAGASPWAGRGATMSVMGGVRVDAGALHAVLAPGLSWVANRSFDFYPSADTTRNVFASPWYAGVYSADLPSRFGADSWWFLEPGGSTVWATIGTKDRSVDIGWSASQQTWGPGVRGGLLLGGSAPGIPRAFVRTSSPIRTSAGRWSATAFEGRLTESRFFDDDPTNDLRVMRAAAISWSPPASDRVVIGLSAASITPRTFIDTSGTLKRPVEQMNSVFASAGSSDRVLRAWVELAHRGPPPSLAAFLRAPQEGVAILLGFETRFDLDGRQFLLSAEAATVEQPPAIRERPPRDLYTSETIPHGWTQRGRPLGHGIGPGGQTQWLSFSRISPKWTGGMFVERTRWNEDAFLRQFLPYGWRHDATVRLGMEGSARLRSQEVTIEASYGKRLNYLFQNAFAIQGFRTIDVAMPRLVLSVAPATGNR